MAPLLRLKELNEEGIKRKNPKKAAVLMLFYPDDTLKTRFVLIHRKTYEGVHSNQVGFPGGKVEKSDQSLEITAIRETNEEVGVPIKEINVIRAISEVYIPPSNFLVAPFLGIVDKKPSFIPQESEVENIIEVLLSDFIDERSVFYEKLSTSYAENIDVPAFKLNGYTVWGATAMILSEVKELLRTLY